MTDKTEEYHFWVIELTVKDFLYECSAGIYGPFDTLEVAELQRSKLVYSGIIKTPRFKFADDAEIY